MMQQTEAPDLRGALESLSKTAMRLKRRHEKLLEALKTYTRCPHGSIECFCTKEASAAVYEDDLYGN